MSSTEKLIIYCIIIAFVLGTILGGGMVFTYKSDAMANFTCQYYKIWNK